eukprot:symbB.v1.2.001020.t4/scaffold52.1/size380577/10
MAGFSQSSQATASSGKAGGLRFLRCAKLAWLTTVGVGLCFTNLTHRCGGRQRVAAGIMFATLRRHAKVDVDSVVNACAKAAKWQQALQVVFRGVGPPDGSALNVAQYTTVLNACGRGWCLCCVGRQWHLAAALFNQMPSLRLQPSGHVQCFDQRLCDSITLATGANCAFLEHDLGSSKALCGFAAMKESPVRPSVISYNTLINALGLGQRWPEALCAWQQMKLEGLQPTVVTIGSLCRQLPGKGSLRILSLCEEAAIRPDLVVCNTLLDNCQRLLQWQRALMVLESMPTFDLQPDEVSKTSKMYLRFYCIVVSWRTLDLWEALQDDMMPSEVTGDVVLSAMSLASKWHMAFQLASRKPHLLGPAGLASSWDSCEEHHQLAASRNLQSILPKKVTARRLMKVWHHSSIAVLLQGTALWWRFLEKLRFRGAQPTNFVDPDVQDAVLPSAAARLWPDGQGCLRCSGLVIQQLRGGVSLPKAPSLGLLPVAFEVSLDSADWSMEIGPVGKLSMKIVLEKREGK